MYIWEEKEIFVGAYKPNTQNLNISNQDFGLFGTDITQNKTLKSEQRQA